MPDKISTFRKRDDAWIAAKIAAEGFSGLSGGLTLDDIKKTVQKRWRCLGLTRTTRAYLLWLLDYTRPRDWAAGARPIVYLSVGGAAEAYGVSARTIYSYEQCLNEACLIFWKDRQDRRRFGRRDTEGGIVLDRSWGVDLAPLAVRIEELRPAEKNSGQENHTCQSDEILRPVPKKASDASEDAFRSTITTEIFTESTCTASGTAAGPEEAAADDNDRERTKAGGAVACPAMDAAWRRIRLTLRAEFGEDAYRSWLKPVTAERAGGGAVRLLAPSPFARRWIDEYYGERLRQLWLREFEGFSDLEIVAGGAEDGAAMDAATDDNGGKDARARNRRQRPPVDDLVAASRADGGDTGAEHIAPADLAAIAGERFRAQLPRGAGGDWTALAAAAEATCGYLDIAPALWRRAVAKMGRRAAAVCVLLIDRRCMFGAADPIRCPGAYLRGCIGRAADGELHLHGSVFGLLRGAAA